MVGKIYLSKAKDKDFPEHYAEHFNSVELNATHYKLYDEATIKKWADKTAEKDFKFCPKMYKGITHFGKLNEKNILLISF